ncbi:MAG: glycosyltransferase [Thermoleophilia bacterium]|nr:glycosyltransferase [Thermoleophilia bacterium]
MLQLVNVGHKSLGDYATLASRGLMDEIRRLAEPLQGKRVAHVSATAFGGGVAEINYTLVPLMVDAGLDVEWRIIRGAEDFFNVTKSIHNALQGDPRSLTTEEQAIFRRYNELNAAEFPADDYDFVIIHDPQPIAIIDSFPDRGTRWIWRGHIDFSTPNAEVMAFLLPSLRRYDDAIFHMHEYLPSADGLPEAVIWPPAIDPLTPKNMALSPEDASYILDQFGIDVERPLLCQVSRFDPWKDPLGVIDAYRAVKQRIPQVQLALVGSMAHDDPEGWEYYNRTLEHAADDPDIFVLSNMNNVGAVEVNAFQVHSSVVIQKSIKEGFGLTVTEALWKARPTVAGRVGGIVAQITDGETGWLVDSSAECAQACIEILRDPAEARTRALKGKEHVRRHFLTPRLLRDWLVLFNRLAGNETGGSTITVVR